jgi:hypothetical protein
MHPPHGAYCLISSFLHREIISASVTFRTVLAFQWEWLSLILNIFNLSYILCHVKDKTLPYNHDNGESMLQSFLKLALVKHYNEMIIEEKKSVIHPKPV